MQISPQWTCTVYSYGPCQKKTLFDQDGRCAEDECDCDQTAIGKYHQLEGTVWCELPAPSIKQLYLSIITVIE